MNEDCPSCGSINFVIARDMNATRTCIICGVSWYLRNKLKANTIEQQLKDENEKLKKIIAKEISENDEFGAEYVIASILREENAKLKEKLELVVKAVHDHAEGGNIENAVYLYDEIEQIINL